MNERIKELAKQSGLIQYDSDDKMVDAEKFAQLIVEDCVAQVALLGISNFDNDDITWTTETAIQNIQILFAKPVAYDHYSDLPKPEAYGD